MEVVNKTMLPGLEPVQKNEVEILSATITVSDKLPDSSSDLEEINAALREIEQELESKICKASTADYAFAVFTGLVSGAIDSLFVGKTEVTKNDFAVANKSVNQFIQSFARINGKPNERLKDAVAFLEANFAVAQDNAYFGAIKNIVPKNHHLADLAHHPTPLGLFSAILVSFLRVGTFYSKDGKLHFKLVNTNLEDLMPLFMAVVAGTASWLISISENMEDEAYVSEMDPNVQKVAKLIASAPLMIELSKVIYNWFGHLCSDMAGSKSSVSKGTRGMGIPGLFISLLYEVSRIPPFNLTDLPKFVDQLYTKQKWDLRHELGVVNAVKKQAVPVVFNELLIRTGFFISRLAEQFSIHSNVADVDWNQVFPYNNRTLDRMLEVSTLTLTTVDLADAALRAAIESRGSIILFTSEFLTRVNFMAGGRLAIAVYKDVKADNEELKLLHERTELLEQKTELMEKQLNEYKEKLNAMITEYIAKDMEEFITGHKFITQGMRTGNSDLIIKGNVVIQNRYHREAQFTNQKEFDDLMDSDLSLVL